MQTTPNRLASLNSFCWTIQANEPIYIPSGLCHAVMNLTNSESAIISESPSFLHPKAFELPNWVDFMLSPAAEFILHRNNDLSIAALERFRDCVQRRMRSAWTAALLGRFKLKYSSDEEKEALNALAINQDPSFYARRSFDQIIARVRQSKSRVVQPAQRKGRKRARSAVPAEDGESTHSDSNSSEF